MYTSSEIVSILDQAELIAKGIIESDIGRCYFTRLDRLQKDEHAQQLVEAFNRQKKVFAEVNQYGKYHPDRKDESEKLYMALQEMELCSVVTEFKLAEKALEELLQELSEIIGQTVKRDMNKGSVCFKGINVAECSISRGKR